MYRALIADFRGVFSCADEVSFGFVFRRVAFRFVVAALGYAGDWEYVVPFARLLSGLFPWVVGVAFFRGALFVIECGLGLRRVG